MELAKLRRVLEEDRRARRSLKNQSQIVHQMDNDESASLAEVDATVAAEADRSKAMPRKSSMKDLTGRLSQKADGTMHIQETERTKHFQQQDEVNTLSSNIMRNRNR